MKSIASFLRVIAFLVIAFLLLEYTIDSGDQLAIEKYPIIWGVLAMLLLFAVAVEIISETLKSILYRGLSAEAQERYLTLEKERKAQEFGGIKRLYKKLLGSKPIEQEGEIVLDHNYDGIRELDNKLPPWWLYGFYITIVFAGIYLVRYHVLDGVKQAQEFENEMEEARLAIEEYKKTAKDLIDASTVELLTDPADITAGLNIFQANCVACHKADGGGGIGPNLTDNYWILGGGIKNVFNTISEGGRSGKGMVPWKNDFKPSEIAQVASYVLSLQGTTPAEPKEPEGDLWTDPEAPSQTPEVQEVVTDSTTVDLTVNN